MTTQRPSTRSPGARPARRSWPTLWPMLGLLLALSLPLVGLGAAAAATTTDAEVIDALARDGRYLSADPEPDLGAAIDRANRDGVAFVWLDRSGDDVVALNLADDYALALADRGSTYHTVLLVVDNGYGASSLAWSQSQLDVGLDAAFDGFSRNDLGVGLSDFADALPAATTPTTGGSASGSEPAGSSGGGIGIGTILLWLVVIGAGFFAVRAFLRRRRSREQAAIELAEDKAEIDEQLKNNADRVIELGDRVIARGDRELIVMYEEASAAYQDVSARLDEAEGAEEIDELDDRIDQAEWQFQVIEAELDGRPRPRPPTPTDGLPPTPDPPATRSSPPSEAGGRRGLPGPDHVEDLEGRAGRPPVLTSPRTGRSYPTSTGTRRRSGRGGGLGGVLADIVLGGGLGGLGGALGGGSRRTTRRVEQRGGMPGSGGLGGGLGGGVLRRGSGSTRRGGASTSSSRSSGGRSIGGGRSKSRGGRRL